MIKKDIELLNGNGFELCYGNYEIKVTPDKILTTTVKATRTPKFQTIKTDLKDETCLQSRKAFINETYGTESVLGDPVLNDNGERVGVQCCLTQFSSSKESIYDSYETSYAFGNDRLVVKHLNRYTYIIDIVIDRIYSEKSDLHLILNIINENLHITLVTEDKKHLDNNLGNMRFYINNALNPDLTESMVIYGCETTEYGEGSNLDSDFCPKPIYTTESINNSIFHNDDISVDTYIPLNSVFDYFKELDI